jgi:serine protease AprX
MKPGFPSSGPGTNNKRWIYTPSSRRSVAEEYFAGAPSWTYCGIGGRSWTIPYAAGVLTMGWQVNPNLGNDEIVNLLFKTAYVNAGGFQFINPPAFIEAVKATLK